MDFACERCRHSYFVPDELVQGRALFRAKCTECGHAFEVKIGAESSAAAPVPAPAAEPARAPRPSPEGRGATTGEAAIAAYEREAAAHRRRNLLLAGGGLLAAVAAVVALVLLPERKAPDASARGAVTDGGSAGSSAAPYADASGLLARPDPPESPPAAGPTRSAPVERKARPRIGRDDRKLLDLLARKDDVAVMAADGEAVDSAQSALDPAAVERTVAANRKAFDACISRALRMNPNLRVARRATLVVTVHPSGSVAGAFIAEEEVDRTELGACLSATARRMVFPAFEGEPLDVSMPLSLSAVF